MTKYIGKNLELNCIVYRVLIKKSILVRACCYKFENIYTYAFTSMGVILLYQLNLS